MTEQEELANLRATVAANEVALQESGERFALMENKWRESQAETVSARYYAEQADRRAAITKSRLARTETSKLKGDLKKYKADFKEMDEAHNARFLVLSNRIHGLLMDNSMQPAWVLAYSEPIVNDPIRQLRLTGGSWFDRLLAAY